MLVRLSKSLLQSRTSSMVLATGLCLFLFACGSGGGGGDQLSGNPNVLPTENDPMIGNGEQQTEAFQRPNFRFELDPAIAERASDFFVQNANTFYPAALEQLNALPGLLPETVVITYRDCGVANAFYRPSDRTITICSELDNAQYNILLDIGFEKNDAFIQSDFSTAFVIDHEIGHALVDILDIPVAGNSESTADAIATVLSVERSLGGATRPYSLFGGLSLLNQPTSYGDEHGSGEDRSGDIICWTVGGRTELLFDPNLANIVQPFVAAGRDCTAEYQNQLSAVRRWLPGFAPRVANADAPSFTTDLNDLIPSRINTQLRHGDAVNPTATKMLHY